MAAMAFKTSIMDLTARFDLFWGQHVGCFAQGGLEALPQILQCIARRLFPA